MPPRPVHEQIESSINPSPADEHASVDAATACRLLGIKPASLYAYVSRGLIRSVRIGRGRTRRYLAADVHRVAVRAAARRGHGPVAAGALRWGEPVLESALTSVAGGVLAYRGRRVEALIDAGVGFEGVAELLWQAAPAPWPAAPTSRRPRRAGPAPVEQMIAALPGLAAADQRAWAAAPDHEHRRARALVCALAAAAGARFAPRDHLAVALTRGLAIDIDHAPLLDAVLIAVADHELNASTFAARIAAAAGAGLYAAVGAALFTFTGARHGGAPARVWSFVDGLPGRGLTAAVRDRLARGDGLPGFGHPLYPTGDPRARLLLDRLPRPVDRAAARRVARARAVVALGHDLTGEHPSLDYALVMIAVALGLPPAWAGGLFALGRTAGWIGHALEQRTTGELLRPRARYVGPAVT